jgi:hypothetical protein
MTIEIRDASLEARIQKQLQATGSSSVEGVLLRLLDTQEEQDRWLLVNREEINAKIRRGIAQLDRGEEIPEDQLDAYLAKVKGEQPTLAELRDRIHARNAVTLPLDTARLVREERGEK